MLIMYLYFFSTRKLVEKQFMVSSCSKANSRKKTCFSSLKKKSQHAVSILKVYRWKIQQNLRVESRYGVTVAEVVGMLGRTV